MGNIKGFGPSELKGERSHSQKERQRRSETQQTEERGGRQEESKEGIEREL